MCSHPFSQLPGDPSLLLVTNLDLGPKKLDIMKACSKAISAATGKPESYIGTSLMNIDIYKFAILRLYSVVQRDFLIFFFFCALARCHRSKYQRQCVCNFWGL
jgi:hypothetical protein